MSWFGPKLARGESILFRRGAFASMTGLTGVVVVFATISGAGTDGMQWPVTEMAVMGMALAALPVAFFASGIRIRLEPGETAPIRPRNQDYWAARVFGLLAIPFLSLAIGLVTLRLSPGGNSNTLLELDKLQTPADWRMVVGAGLGTFLILRFAWQRTLNKLDLLFLTNRRTIRFTPGFWFGRIEVLALADIAEIREGPSGITLVATSRDAMRRLRKDGSTEPAGIDRLDLPLTRFRFPGTAKSQYDRALRLLGREPLRWHAPTLPRAVERLVSLNAKLPDIIAALILIPLLTLFIADVVRLDVIQGLSHDTLAAAVLASFVALSGLSAISYCLFLWLAARRLTPENAALFLRASFHPDWAPGRSSRTPYTAARRAALKRRQRIGSWLAGRPVPFENAAGPEAFGGGWRE